MPQCLAGPTGHCGCLLGQSGHFDRSHAMKTQSFDNSQKSVFSRILVVGMCMKEWFARVETIRDVFSDLRVL